MSLNPKPRIFALLILAFVAVTLLLSGCKDFSFFSELGIKGGLNISPSEVTVPVNSSVTFTASGGNPPYTYGLAGGTGSIDAATGVYTAPAAASNDVVVVTDSTGQSGTASVTVASTLEGLKISPTTASVSVSNSISFIATGGVGPYTFDFQTNNSGGSVTPGGVYTAGSATGVSDTIIVTDSDTPAQTCSVPAVVSVTAAVTNIDYSISGDTFPASAFAASSISGDFTIHNGGSATGTASISWWLFISEDGTFGGEGEHLIASGTVTDDIPDSGNYVAAPTGNWPSDLPQGNYDLFVMVSSPDDLDHGNNVSTASTFTVAAPRVDYTVSQVEHTGGGENAPGQPFTGRFMYSNNGPLAEHNGARSLSWAAYASHNTNLDAEDVGVASGNGLSRLDLGASSLNWIDFSGTWPLDYGDYYLIVKVNSLDNELDTANDWDYSASATQIGVYTDLEPNDEYQNLPGGPGGYDILFGTDPATPIVLNPGMSIQIEGLDIGSLDKNDTFMFNAGTANTITFTLIWSTGTDCLDIWVYEAGDPAPSLVAVGGLADLLSASTIKGPGADEFLENQDLWFNVFYNKGAGNTGAYTAIITAN